MSAKLACTIRPAREDDERVVAALLETENLDTRFVPEEFLVAEDGDAIVGCARLRVLPEGDRELASVAVVPDRRGQGIGRALVERALAQADGPVYALCLEPGFFEHLGFEKLGEVPEPLQAKAQACCADRGFVPMRWRPSE